MNIYFDNPKNSFAISRIIVNLEKYLPKDFTRVKSRDEADLVILHAYGRNDHVTKYSQALLKQGKKYAVIQYALKSTRNPDPKDWYQLWNSAKVVWSYYDLGSHIKNFYRSPLAADPKTFFRQNLKKDYLIGMLGNKNYYSVECFGEIYSVIKSLGKKAIHVGDMIDPNPNIIHLSNINDDELRFVYNGCQWFSALRRKEGFELVAVEAMLCGVRPIMFNMPDYKFWFKDLAKFISVNSYDETIKNLIKVLNGNPKPLTNDEIEEVKKRFNWQKITKGFWDRCMN